MLSQFTYSELARGIAARIYTARRITLSEYDVIDSLNDIELLHESETDTTDELRATKHREIQARLIKKYLIK